MLRTLIEWRARWTQRYYVRELVRLARSATTTPCGLTDAGFCNAWNSRPWKGAPIKLGKTAAL
jgi:hypothetical protein